MNTLRWAPAACWLALSAASALADQLTVTVLDRRTNAPLGGTYTQIGPGPGIPFAGNWGLTDGTGQLTLQDPALSPGLPVTVAPVGYARLTVLDCPVGALTIWCDPAAREEWPDTAMISGVVRGLPIVNTDSYLDVGIVMGAIAPEQVLSGGIGMLVSSFMDTMHIGFPVNTDVPIPENIDIPSQTALFIVNFFKEPYTQRFPTGDTVDMICLGYRVDVNDLVAGEPQQVVATKATASRNYLVPGDAVVNHTCSVNFVHGVQVTVSGLPGGSKGYVASLGELTASPRKDRYVPLHGVQCRAEVDTTVSISYLPATGVFADLAAYSGVAYTDTSAQPTWGGGAFDWTALSPGATRTFDAFYLPPELARVGDEFSFGGYQPAGTPHADWATSSFMLDDRSDADHDSLLWEVMGPASLAAFELPQLGGAAPGWTTLPDPSYTPANDALVWSCAVVAAPTVGLQEFLESPLRDGEFFAFRSGDAPPLAGPAWVTVAAQTAQDLMVTWAPVPNALEYVVWWASAPWIEPQGSSSTAGTSYLDAGALPAAGLQRYYTLMSRAGLSRSVPTPPVGGASWALEDGR
ncbi:MAG: hypothetical protein MUE60_02425 [Candidatus Eisenbacteria bacterium]|jgi:hypothetical protein|nr:hypothetical protein [Candidatus Eisenbacteria bacterium]